MQLTMTAPIHWRPPRWGRMALMGVLAGVFMLPGFGIGPGQDQSIFMVLGRGLLNGEMPYRDLWDHKPPGIYLITALADLLPGDFWGWLWILSVVAVTATAYIVLTMTFRHVAMLALLLLASYPATQGGGMTETFAVAFGAGAFVLVERRPFVAGLLAALAVVTSLQLVALLPALLLLNRRWLIGMAAGIVPFLVWLDLPSAWDAVVVYSRAYLALDRSGELGDQLPAGALMLGTMLVWVPLARPSWDRRQWAAAVWLLGGILLVALNGRLFAHYVTPLIVPAAILAAPGLRASWWARKNLWPLALGLTVVWGVLLAPWPY